MKNLKRIFILMISILMVTVSIVSAEIDPQRRIGIEPYPCDHNAGMREYIPIDDFKHQSRCERCMKSFNPEDHYAHLINKIDDSTHSEFCLCGHDFGVKPHSKNYSTSLNETSHESVCTCGHKMGTFTHTMSNWNNAGSYHTRTCGECRYKEDKPHTWSGGKCTTCNVGCTNHRLSIVRTPDYFPHYYECKTCGTKVSEPHNFVIHSTTQKPMGGIIVWYICTQCEVMKRIDR